VVRAGAGGRLGGVRRGAPSRSPGPGQLEARKIVGRALNTSN